MSNLAQEIKDYYGKRGLNSPNLWEALGWVHAELGEVYEVLFSWNPNWVRNNPEKHPVKTKEDLAEELGDAIFMLVVAGLTQGVDPIDALRSKMYRKVEEDKNKKMSANFSITAELPTQLELFEAFGDKDGS